MTRSCLLRGVFALGLTAAAACSDKMKSRVAADSDLTRDLALAGAQPVQQPTFQDTAVAPAPTPAARAKQEPPAPVRAKTSNKPVVKAPRPVTTTPAPQPAPVTVAAAPAPVAPASAPAPATIGSGTGIGVTSGSKVCSGSNLPGDKLVATVNSPITGSNGATIPAGSAVVLEVASASNGPNGDAAQLTFRVRAVEINGKDYPAAADVTTDASLQKQKVQGADPNADKKKVIGGAIAGAILGQMIGHNTKGTVIGAAAGAAAGAAVAKTGEKWEACLPAGSQLRITLNQPIVIS
ncbi:MAG TPA: YMGG-like glycine zipper-containing protein [Gemmatimonadaceae bacterium]|nr:YMGG-like glycine zipper-containing protein [Gemmatimonadaceae bacterium]